MAKKQHLFRMVLLAVLLWPFYLQAQTPTQIKVSVFNFGTTTADSSGYGTTVTNMLISSLSADPTLAMLDRKELESFLSINDLQQNDVMDNVIQIGARLGLDVIVVGTVEKTGNVINIKCNVVQIDHKRSILRTRVVALGDAGLISEVRKLSETIRKSLTENLLKQRDDERSGIKSPVNIQKRSGNQKVSLYWEQPDGKSAGFEVYRSSSEKGPYARIAQVTKPEYTDEGITRNTIYYYKIRTFDHRGLRSGFSVPVAAETALTPNPPVIIATESHIKSIALTWSPGPRSDDPLKLKGYKLFRAKVESGPYKEIANILGTDLGLGLDTTLDKLLKVPYLDKGLADGEDYYYKTTAYNEKGLESDFSRPVKGTAIPVVSGLAARGEMVREIELVWNHQDLPYIRGYYVYRSTSPDTNFLKIKKVPTEPGPDKKIRYNDTEGLADKTRYYYRVTALEEADLETSASVTVSAVTRGKPAMPQNLQAKSGLVKKVELFWTAGSDADVEGYRIYWSKDQQGPFQSLKTLQGRTVDRFTDESRGMARLGDGEVYHYHLKSFNKVNVESEATPTIAATTKKRPVKPVGLKSEGVNVKRIVLQWQANPERDIVAYHILRSDDGRGDNFAALGRLTGQTQYPDQPLNDGQTYQYKIQAEDKDGLLSDFSDVLKAATKPRPGPPHSLSGNPKEGGAEITWKQPQAGDIVSYTVYQKGFFKPEKIAADVIGTSYLDKRPLKAGKERVYVVTATDRDHLESDFSQDIMVIGQ